MNKTYFKLFANCIIVKGASRATICDLQRNKFQLIPLSLIDFFDDKNLIDLEKIKKQITEDSIHILNEYMDLLIENEFIFECNLKESKLFPSLSMDFDYPSTISNAIIDYDKNSNHNFQKIIDEYLIPTNCRHIQFRFYDGIELNYLNDIIKIVNESFIKSIEIIVKYNKTIPLERLKEWVSENKKIKSVTLHSYSKNQIVQEENFGFGIIVAVKQEINDESHCGIVHHNYFNVLIESFTESQNHNTCLNRKLSIDKNGNIKNCPSMSQSFGNIKDTTLEVALNHKEFKKYWNITKDQIEVCKDCEFRHICTDCRAYIEEPENQYSKPLKCGYNPYTNKWEEWSVNPLKQKAIKHYVMQDLVKK
ncbi:grasp-with-spasm system SPASM domain peptide maturase [Flavobacterium jejuense]|uniref:Grasp-with-spasm system SPASM domain peptide maturase n=1 Tax=Flavobacterium jejuense TaxID=1544455 RepID=A0ABX0IQZ2_9FLAO|nr:grasp-with-spasm system SPASM domain peptide maturase [Flavobacterium jejuense]NHN26123.1 grasp-with-spasm system SPASM domain peptide maturase [Flavobacterium jejuense]